MTTRSTLAMGAVLVALLGAPSCDDNSSDGSADDGPESTAPSADETDREELFTYTDLEVDDRPLPDRFEAPLPTSPDEFESGAHPPLSHVSVQVCRGDAEAGDAFVEAVEEAFQNETMTDDLAYRYERLIGECSGTQHCDWLVETADSDISAETRGFLAPALAKCPGSEAFEAIDREDLPLDAVIAYYLNLQPAQLDREGEAFPAHRRLAEAVEAQVQHDVHYQARKGGAVLRHLEERKALEIARSVRASLDDPTARAYVGLGLRGSSIPEARQLWEQACEKPALEQDQLCEEPKSDGESSDTISLERRVRGWSFDAESYLASNPDASDGVREALSNCAAESRISVQLRNNCLTQLGAIDYAAARETAEAWTETDYPLGVAARSLRRFETRTEAVVQLRDWRLIESGGGSVDSEVAERAVTASGLLSAYGRLHKFDARSGVRPVGHDRLLSELAARAGSPLADVVFDEIPPESDANDDESEVPHRLLAYHDGSRYRTTARALGKWYDLEAVVGMLNSLARRLESDRRFLALHTNGQLARVAIGPKDGLVAAADAGVLRAGSPGRAVEIGRGSPEDSADRGATE